MKPKRDVILVLHCDGEPDEEIPLRREAFDRFWHEQQRRIHAGNPRTTIGEIIEDLLDQAEAERKKKNR